MDSYIKKRVIDEYNYLIITNKTIRQIAEVFNVSKSTVHIDFHDRLKEIDLEKYYNVRKIMNEHLEKKGGMN